MFFNVITLSIIFFLVPHQLSKLQGSWLILGDTGTDVGLIWAYRALFHCFLFFLPFELLPLLLKKKDRT